MKEYTFLQSGLTVTYLQLIGVDLLFWASPLFLVLWCLWTFDTLHSLCEARAGHLQPLTLFLKTESPSEDICVCMVKYCLPSSQCIFCLSIYINDLDVSVLAYLTWGGEEWGGLSFICWRQRGQVGVSREGSWMAGWSLTATCFPWAFRQSLCVMACTVITSRPAVTLLLLAARKGVGGGGREKGGGR